MSHHTEKSTSDSPTTDYNEDEREITVSVIMITYNQEDTIDNAVRSVLSQKTDFDYELIIANDASTDGTGERVRKWAEAYPTRIVAINRTENLGLQKNFLDAFRRVRGKYIAICEGDDWWCSSKKLARQAALMEREKGCDICFHRVINYYEDDGTMSLSRGGIPSILPGEELGKSNIITNLSVMYRTRAFAQVDLEELISDLRLFDYALHILAACGSKVLYINKPMAVYRQRRKGIWSGGERDTQLRMAMATRIRLIQYFTNLVNYDDEPENPTMRTKKIFTGGYGEMVANLIPAMNQIALSLILQYESRGMGDDDPPIDFVKKLIRQYSPDWDDDRIALEKRKRRKLEARMKRKGISYIFTIIRRFFSRLLPVPRIRHGVAVPE